MKIYNLLSILSIITIFVINTVQAFDIKSSLKNKILKKNKENSTKTKNENYYMIFVNNGSSNSGSHSKREEEQLINSLIDEITTLIIDNKNTYKNPSKLEGFEKRSSLRKRENQNNKSALAYTISSLDDRTIIYSYLSDYVADKVKKLPNVIACAEDRKLYLSDRKGDRMDEMNKLNEVLNETQWSGVSVRENADIHLSLLSQGKYDGNSTTSYDKNYYYPSSAGKDIDIFVFDSGFNFQHPEFANKDERTIKCAFATKNGEIIPIENEDYCELTYGKEYHGLMVSDIAGGLTHGVAGKANIYGIALQVSDEEDDYPSEYPSGSDEYPNNYDEYPSEYDEYPSSSDEFPTDYSEIMFKEGSDFYVSFISNVLAALKYVDDNMLRPNKAVFNFSFIIPLNELIEEDQYIIDYFRDYIDHMSSKGAVFVACAGNESELVEKDGKLSYYPCSFDNVICAGAVDNLGEITIMEIKEKMHSQIELLEDESNFNVDEINEKIKEYRKKYNEEKDNINNLFKEKIMDPRNYRKAAFSNYGKVVDIHAPGYVELEYRDVDGEDIKEIGMGTSFSSPIVAGVAATIMSENPNIKFDSKKMLDYLIEIGQKNIIEGISEGDPNVFINNGKHSIYSGNNDDEEIDLNDEKTSDTVDSDEEEDSFIEIETDDVNVDEVDDEIETDDYSVDEVDDE
ncbi:subtilisin-like protein [Neocallimastix californiae]|uniref:Subtilisin-like protein n=1 Tax=Neocallimastix californiae TaxID=1754190 RepID=A0A1Y2DFA7_9FUNG|nr:subtilisin-like protein [Neocallimastix californiae]|eukprot:ORY57963.1 subtilisin-like protein [Neocallimastix californiae]